MTEISSNLRSYVWKFSWIYASCVVLCLVVFELFNIEPPSAFSMIQLMVAAMATRMMFVQKEQRKLEKTEKTFLVNACFVAAWVISLVVVGLFGLYLVFTLGFSSVQMMLSQLLGSIDLPTWIWLVIIAVVCLILYGSLVLGFGDFFGQDEKMLAAQRKKQASK